MRIIASLSLAALTACAAATTTATIDPPVDVETSSSEIAVSQPATAIAATPAATQTVSKPPAKPENFVATEAAPANLAKQADFAEAMRDAADLQRVFNDEPTAYTLEGDLAQGGIVFGKTAPGARVRLDGADVMVGADGQFVFGFGRDTAASALLVVTQADGAVERRTLEIANRDFPVERIDGLDQSKVSGYTKAQLEKIAVDRDKKNAARAKTQSDADWAAGFDWPMRGRISGVFGSQRILNGEPKRPHSGLDIAAPTGTPVRAPASGTIRLAEHGMYFEGGLILLDHGHWLESAFLHLSEINVEAGQYVEKGEVIGAVGATGRVTGPHLHWSMKWQGRLVDPRLTLPDEE